MILTFPEYIFINDEKIKETRIKNVVRSEVFSNGMSRQAPTTYRTRYIIQMEISVSLSDYENFYNFFERQINRGSNWFMMKCPLRGKQYRYRFLDQDLDWDKDEDQMVTSIRIERWGSGSGR